MAVEVRDVVRGGFHERLGYRGKRTMREKQLPPPGAVRTRLATRALGELSDLHSGIPVADDPLRMRIERRG